MAVLRLAAVVGLEADVEVLADGRYAYETAVSLLEQAVDASDRGNLNNQNERRADLLGRLLRAQVRAGGIAAARATRQRAADAAAGTSAGRAAPTVAESQ